MASTDYVALDDGLASPFSLWRHPVRLAVGLAGMALTGIAGLAGPSIMQFAKKKGGSKLQKAFEDDIALVEGNQPFVPNRGIPKVLIKPGKPGLLQVPLPSSDNGPFCLFTYGSLMEHDMEKTFSEGAKISAGWVYGAKIASPGTVALPTGKGEDVLKGKMLCWPAATFEHKIIASDKARGYNPSRDSKTHSSKPNEPTLWRETVSVVDEDGDVRVAWCYLEETFPTNGDDDACLLDPDYDWSTHRSKNAQTISGNPAAGAVFGETGGAMLVLEDLAVNRGNKDLLRKITLRVMPKERWGIVGVNGAGKSTLLGAITGRDQVRVLSGKVAVKMGVRVGYLEQTAVSGSTKTVRQETMSRMDRLVAAKAALERATNAVEGGDYSEDALNALNEATSAFESAGGYSADETVSKVLKGLGFSETDMERSCADFSGGWQMRIALARLLLSVPELMLLDEPTNHLDAAARDWLAAYLADFEGTLILVSHDEGLLSAAINSVAEVSGGGLVAYRGKTLPQWKVARAERAMQIYNKWEKQKEECEELEDFIRRFGAKASKASQAKDREQKLKKLRAEMKQPPAEVMEEARRAKAEREEKGRKPISAAQIFADAEVNNPAAHGAAGNAKAAIAAIKGGARRPKNMPIIKLPPPPKCGFFPLQLKKAAIGWMDPKTNKPLVTCADSINLEIEKNMRLVIRGPNGAGKSTLVKALAGVAPLLAGTRKEDDRLALGYFSQDLSQELDQTATALEVVTSTVRKRDITIKDEQVRAVMGALGLKGETSLRLVGHLSGGEKARVALAIFALTPCNVYILDEPSNHLDSLAIQGLLIALQDYPGAIIIVSHDRSFCEAVGATHVATVKDGHMKIEARGLVDKDWQIDSVEQGGNGPVCDIPATGITPLATPTPPKGEKQKGQKPQKEIPKRIKKIESEVKKLEAELASIDEEMVQKSSDASTLMELTQKRDPLAARIASCYAEWEDLNSQTQ
eukprot:gb/GEZN01001144.1/.p1 GENE.gb/GEZN01001144.1/~~gb/GEZN01001144.1/.p1  ORF type:complete len:977 (-),score=172.20 gb/GEZN01001144.1/:300-3230(-)